MDINSKGLYPANELSNFAAHEFEIDGVKCASMEGFLQSLVTPEKETQIEICQLVGIFAKKWGAAHRELWQKEQKLWWQGREYDRHGDEYQKLLDRAYNQLLKNEDFQKALLSTGTEILVHTIGCPDPHLTILTEEEFCSRLMKLRERGCL